ncbi:phosphate signaling complex protein PhoU [Nocardia sp. NPDC051570]|uniref:phosphate signaling complex protein PhoU n=1 Tax=Nocardia sp. NPDC051570 TaxID=3364324 RepID=UPI00378D2BCE
MREAFHEQMTDLARTLDEAAEQVCTAMDQATRALLTADPAAAQAVVDRYHHITALTRAAEEKSFRLLVLQAPVAGDLRSIVSEIQIVDDLRRMGALARHVADIGRRRQPNHFLPQHIAGYLGEIGRAAVALGASAAKALRTRDPQHVTQLSARAQAIDLLHHRLTDTVMNPHRRHGIQTAVDVTLVSGDYERFAAHAAAIGQRVLFLVTGAAAPDPQPEPTYEWALLSRSAAPAGERWPRR